MEFDVLGRPQPKPQRLHWNDRRILDLWGVRPCLARVEQRIPSWIAGLGTFSKLGIKEDHDEQAKLNNSCIFDGSGGPHRGGSANGLGSRRCKNKERRRSRGTRLAMQAWSAYDSARPTAKLSELSARGMYVKCA